MTNEMLMKVRALMESEEFGKEIENVETADELKTALESHDVEISLQEVDEICAGIASKSSDLSEDDLDNVSGGGFLAGCAIVAGAWAVSYVAGYVAGKVIKKKTGVCM